MSFSNPAFQRRLQQINAQTGGDASSPGLRDAMMHQAAKDQAATDYTKMLRSQQFANKRNMMERELGLGAGRLGLARDRLGLSRQQQEFNFGMKNEYLGIAQDELNDSINQMKLGTALGVGQLGLQGYLNFKNKKKAAKELAATEAMRKKQMTHLELQIAEARRKGVKI